MKCNKGKRVKKAEEGKKRVTMFPAFLILHAGSSTAYGEGLFTLLSFSLTVFIQRLQYIPDTPFPQW
jgi:hypothetical protein